MSEKYPDVNMMLYSDTPGTKRLQLPAGNLTVHAYTRCGLSRLSPDGVLIVDTDHPEPHRFVATACKPNQGATYPVADIRMQCGHEGEVGINGITLEALLTISKVFLERQNVMSPCDENRFALLHIQSAIDLLNSRTDANVWRGDGTDPA